MPTITLSKKALLDACTKKRSDEELKDRISFLGTDLEGITHDEIRVEIFPNRPDLLSQQGFNRAFTSFVGDHTGLRKYTAKKNSKNKVIIDATVADVRPYTACAIVKGLHCTDTAIKDIIQIQEKLHITYGRNRKRCAIGIYPLEHITLPITYTAKKPEDIIFKPLESTKEMNGLQILSQHPTGKAYGALLEGKKHFPIFIDAAGNILSMPPIINSEKTGRITEKTTEVFVECSGFSYSVVHGALAMIVTALADIGGNIEEMTLHYPKELGGEKISPNLHPTEVPFKTNYINNYLGYDFTDKDIKKYLGKMGMGCSGEDGKLIAEVPSYRTDILHPIDLTEDIAIAYGMDNIDAVIPAVATIAQEQPLGKFSRKLREILIGHGLLEIKNYNITSKENQTTKILSTEEVIQVASAASQEYDTLRRSILPSVFATFERNKHHEYPQNVFEIGEVFSLDEKKETGVSESTHICVALCTEQANYTSIRQILDSLFDALDMQYTIKSREEAHYISGRSGEIIIGKQSIGSIGEIHPQILENYGLPMPVASLELDIRALLELHHKNKNM
jgi:phenylalanyl-tRNA synthetase beta chain